MTIFNQIVDAIKNSNLIIADDHNGGNDVAKIDAVVLLADGEIGGLCTGVPQCLNNVYLDKQGKPHLSTRSINGPLYYPSNGLDGYLQDDRVMSILHIDAEGQEWTYHK